MKPKVEHKKRRGLEDTKTKLLNAALDIFAKEGYDAATTRQIAKKAGVNESLIQRYFESKHGLFRELQTLSRERFLSDLGNYDENQSLEAELVEFMKKKLQRSTRDKKFFKIAISRAILDAKVRNDVQKMSAMVPRQLVERFERFRNSGKIRTDVDLDQVIQFVMSLSFMLSLLADALECIEPDEANRLIETISKIVADGLSPKKS